jgi:alkylation response protein AidB-like acyl-CoA dehydrogenase
MYFSIPKEIQEETGRFKAFLSRHLSPHLSEWYEQGAVPRTFFSLMAEQGWFSFSFSKDRITKHQALREALFAEELVKLSPGVAVAILAHQDLGLTGLWLFGSPLLQRTYGPSAVAGKILLCIGNTAIKGTYIIL